MSPTSPFQPVSPLDMTRGSNRTPATTPPQSSEDKNVTMTSTRSVRTNSTDSKASEPRRARFAEATTINSPAVEDEEHRLPWSRRKREDKKPKVSDLGLTYIQDNGPVEQHATLRPDTGDAPLKSALKTPGTAGRLLNPLSPTFREEQMLEKEEDKTEVQQAKDLKVKTRVRMAKMVLRFTNFSCSLIVLSMLSTTFTIFNATRHLPARNNLPAWATTTKTWPQTTVLVVSCVSLFFSVIVIGAYWRGGHRGAAKTAVYYSMFAVGYFVFSTVMWLVAAGILHGSKASGNGQDVWGWSCNDNKRRQLFQDDVHYALVCRLQNWSLVCCIIEVVVELITIAIYSVVFYRFYSKNKLRKSMENRDRARSDLYLAQLKAQSAPNTPGYYASGHATPRTPGFPSYGAPPLSAKATTMDPYSAAETGQSHSQSFSSPTHNGSGAFKLQAPPIRVQAASPPVEQNESSFAEHRPSSPPAVERRNEHIGAAPGEQTYDAVPIPGAYAPLNSPGFAH